MPKSASSSPATADAKASANGKQPRTFHSIVAENNLTVRTMCSGLRVAAETLRAAYDEPGRLSVNAVLAFSEMVNEEPEKVFADLHAEIKELRKKGPATEAPKRSRTLKAKNKEAD